MYKYILNKVLIAYIYSKLLVDITYILYIFHVSLVHK